MHKKKESKEKPHHMLHGHLDGKMPHEHGGKGKKEKEGHMMKGKKKAKKKKVHKHGER